jgi:hypothetical protein
MVDMLDGLLALSRARLYRTGIGNTGESFCCRPGSLLYQNPRVPGFTAYAPFPTGGSNE